MQNIYLKPIAGLRRVVGNMIFISVVVNVPYSYNKKIISINPHFNYIHFFWRLRDLGYVHTILDSFCAGTKTLPDRASFHT